MPKLELPPSEMLYPTPVVLVSCADKSHRKKNIITIAWCGVAASNPPTLNISIRPSRLSHRLIKGTGDYAVNIPTSDMLEEVDMCGVISGFEVDKFMKCKLTEEPASKIRSPLIKECPVNIECSLRDIIKLGSHDMFLGEVVAVHADGNIVGEGGNIDYEKAKPIVYNKGKYWDLGKELATHGFSKKIRK